MRHPLLRILVALFIGVITPLCCCQAMAVVGSGCGESHVAAVEAESCCGGCAGDSVSEQGRDGPTEDQRRAPSGGPGECPSCQSCDGVAGGTAAKPEAKLTAFELLADWLVSVTVATLWMLPSQDTKSVVRPPGWASDPPFLKANREALRWHCALLV